MLAAPISPRPRRGDGEEDQPPTVTLRVSAVLWPKNITPLDDLKAFISCNGFSTFSSILSFEQAGSCYLCDLSAPVDHAAVAGLGVWSESAGVIGKYALALPLQVPPSQRADLEAALLTKLDNNTWVSPVNAPRLSMSLLYTLPHRASPSRSSSPLRHNNGATENPMRSSDPSNLLRLSQDRSGRPLRPLPPVASAQDLTHIGGKEGNMRNRSLSLTGAPLGAIGSGANAPEAPPRHIPAGDAADEPEPPSADLFRNSSFHSANELEFSGGGSFASQQEIGVSESFRAITLERGSMRVFKTVAIVGSIDDAEYDAMSADPAVGMPPRELSISSLREPSLSLEAAVTSTPPAMPGTSTPPAMPGTSTPPAMPGTSTPPAMPGVTPRAERAYSPPGSFTHVVEAPTPLVAETAAAENTAGIPRSAASSVSVGDSSIGPSRSSGCSPDMDEFPIAANAEISKKPLPSLRGSSPSRRPSVQLEHVLPTEGIGMGKPRPILLPKSPSRQLASLSPTAKSVETTPLPDRSTSENPKELRKLPPVQFRAKPALFSLRYEDIIGFN